MRTTHFDIVHHSSFLVKRSSFNSTTIFNTPQTVAFIFASLPQSCNCNKRVTTLSHSFTATHTVPTGFSGVPPPGPATPDVATAQSAPKRSETPFTISRTTSSLTAPCSHKVSFLTPRTLCFILLWYATTPPSITSEHPAIRVTAPATAPPVQLSAVAKV